jgi:hypothetical protein
MGMYATIGGKEIKFSGLLAEVAERNGVVAENGMATIPRALSTVILTDFVFAMEAGRQLTAGDNIQGQAIYKLAKDAAALAALFNWVIRSDEDAIDFA